MMKDISGYEGLYAITDDGQVWSYSKNDFKAQSINQSGYLVVRLYKNNECRMYTVHRLVAEAFIPNPEGFEVINHKDENKHNNNVGNLEWCTAAYNVAYTCNKKVMCVETGEIFSSVKDAAASVNRHSPTMCSHLKGKTSNCGGRHFKYVEESDD